MPKCPPTLQHSRPTPPHASAANFLAGQAGEPLRLLQRRKRLRCGVDLALVKMKASGQYGCSGDDRRKNDDTHYCPPYSTLVKIRLYFLELTIACYRRGDAIATVIRSFLGQGS